MIATIYTVVCTMFNFFIIYHVFVSMEVKINDKTKMFNLKYSFPTLQCLVLIWKAQGVPK